MIRPALLRARGLTTAAMAVWSAVPASWFALYVPVWTVTTTAGLLSGADAPAPALKATMQLVSVLYVGALLVTFSMVLPVTLLRLAETVPRWAERWPDEDGPPTLPWTTRAVLRAGGLIRLTGAAGLVAAGAGLFVAWQGLGYGLGAAGAWAEHLGSLALLGLFCLTPSWVALKRAEADRGIVALLTKAE